MERRGNTFCDGKEIIVIALKKLKRSKKEINRLTEQSNFEIISSSHKKLNGELQTKLTAAENKIKDFEENYIKIDGKK